jgi:hypothetical protein
VNLYGPRIDVERVRLVLREFLDVIGDPGRLVEFDRLVSRWRTSSASPKTTE